MDGLIAFWTHALAALLFVSLALWQLRSGAASSDQRLLIAALSLTALWAGAAALAGDTPLVRLAETGRNLLWVGLIHALAVADRGSRQRQPGLRLVHGAVAAVLGCQLLVDLLPLVMPAGAGAESTLAATGRLLRITAAAGALVLVHNVYGQAAPSSRPGSRPSLLALVLLWTYDLNFYTLAELGPNLAAILSEWRGAAVAAAAPLLAIGGQTGNWRVRPSRAATFQSLSLLAIAVYFAVMTILATVLRGASWDLVRLLAVAALMAMTVAALLLVPSPRARSWAKVKLAKHLFEHRYDYRTEWLRFTETLGRSGPGSAPLGDRVVQAFAALLEAPGGLLLAADGADQIAIAAACNWGGALPPAGDCPRDFWRQLEADGTIVELDPHRQRWAMPRGQTVAVPAWMVADPAAWLAIPLIHHQRLAGVVLLAAPDYRRQLDWEDFDLLRAAGRQAASSLAEAHNQLALLNAQRFEDFNRRFAFILHDIKNVVSQLSLLSRNAERHAGNAEFQADMVSTLKSSVGKMNDLLGRLSPAGPARPERALPTALRPVLADVVAAKRRAHDVRLLGDGSLWALADAVALEQAVGHLLQNAIDASPSDQPVLVRAHRSADEVAIEIVDHGCGMEPDFVRHRLFQPFASTKADGFGVGAFEARSLVAAMGGRLTVTSWPGKGSHFVIHLPAAEPANLRKSA